MPLWRIKTIKMRLSEVKIQNGTVSLWRKGMKWGIRRSNRKYRTCQKEAFEKNVKKIDKILSSSGRGFGKNQSKVLSKYNSDRLKDEKSTTMWDKAFKAGRGSKEYAEYERYEKDFENRYADLYVDAFLSDNNFKRISESGRAYIHDHFIRK